jgi:Fe-S-cluster-containing dehydrogenase component
MARFAMVIDPDRCVDCKACMVACTAENEVPLGKHRNRVERKQRGTYPELSMRIEPIQCMHCDSPPCVRVCPTGASHIPDGFGGIVMVEPDKCIGCRYCMLACPYDARYFDEEKGTVGKCTFCLHRLGEGREPACVETCPTKVRVFGDTDLPISEAARKLRKRATEKKKVEAGTGPNLHYVID